MICTHVCQMSVCVCVCIYVYKERNGGFPLEWSPRRENPRSCALALSMATFHDALLADRI